MNFDIRFLKEIGIQKGKSSKRKKFFKNVVCSFDIETTNDDEIQHAWMYSWMLDFHGYAICMGRTWEEFLELLEDINLCLEDNEMLCIFVHNLSFEFMFLKGVLKFESEDVFSVKSRKVLLARYNKVEFRCSYLHSNMSLSKFTEKMKVKHIKMSGEEYDYNKMRYPWTELTYLEICYQLHDVLGLSECIEKEMGLDGDDFYTLPYTSTGYVRRDAKEVMTALVKSAILPAYPNKHIYEMLREEFRGGDTHANRYYAGMVLKEPMRCFDYASEYPAAMLTRKYPMGKFTELGNCDKKTVLDLIFKKEKAVLMRVFIKKPVLKDERNGFPYLSLSKCRNVPFKSKDTDKMKSEHDDFVDTLLDNGRILQAYCLETTINDIDFKILSETYTWDYIIFLDVAYASYGSLPNNYKSIIINYFEKKTFLKNVEGEEYYYDKAKNKLNALYGMMVQDPGKAPIIFTQEGDDEGKIFSEGTEDIEIYLNEYKKRNFLLYQWGVWVTSWGRYMLHEARKCCEFDEVVYCDTDSLKGFMSNDAFDFLNKRNIQMAIDNKATAEKNGKNYYMGTLEEEKGYQEFITWGAKKYGYIDEKGELKITIAGVDKKKGAKELEESGGLAKLRIGYQFKKAGGGEAVYNDNVDFTIEREGQELRITDNVFLRGSEYTLGVSKDYGIILGI